MTHQSQPKPLTYAEERAAIALWREHGGDTFGPRVEHVSMPLARFWGFLAAFSADADMRVTFALNSANGWEAAHDEVLARAQKAEAKTARLETAVKRLLQADEGGQGVGYAEAMADLALLVAQTKES